MNIKINNNDHPITDSASISEALSQLKIDSGKGTAIAVNNNVIPKTEWEKYTLKENDKITIIKATQGG